MVHFSPTVFFENINAQPKQENIRQNRNQAGKEKANPLAGCLPILLQITVFFALYKVLTVTLEMRQAPLFGWIKDLSVPDPYSIFNLFGFIPIDLPSFLF